MEDRKLNALPDEELDQVVGGLGDKTRAAWYLNGNFNTTRLCAQCGTEITGPRGVFQSQLCFCSETCYQEYLKNSNR